MATIAQNLNTLGFAPVIVHVAGDGNAAAKVGKHFTPEPTSQLGSASLAEKALAGAARPRADSARVYPHLGVVYGTIDRDGLAALRADPSVSKITAAPEFSLIRPVASEKASLREPNTWGLETMGIPELWNEGLSGRGVRVAHLDTGVDTTHPALRNAVFQFAEFDRAGREKLGSPPSESDTEDAHGTHTAGTIAGRPVKGRHIGVAPGADLFSAMVIEGGAVVARILGGMDWAVSQKVNILSMSVGIRGLVTDFLPIVDILRSNEILPVIAVGNEGPGTSRSPGNYPKALSVGAHDKQLEVADFSSSQRFVRKSQHVVPDVVAPGVDVISAGLNGSYRSLSGTSMATPHVAGLAALLLEARPDASAAKLESAILSSAVPGTMDRDRVNRGAVDARRALEEIRKG
jgi:subtilisin